ncbi:MAG: hypothetical protein JST14_15880 [Bacteroidetes bacterium]|nr:hypothetical protein [Bacteroidota bacterium]
MRQLLSLFIVLASMNAFAQTSAITQEEIMQMVSKGKGYTLVFLKKGPNRETVDKATLEKNQMDHLRHMMNLKRQGVLPLFGPFTDEGDIRGICIYNSTDKEKVMEWLAMDPHIKSGYLTYEIKPWFGIPGDQLPN